MVAPFLRTSPIFTLHLDFLALQRPLYLSSHRGFRVCYHYLGFGGRGYFYFDVLESEIKETQGTGKFIRA